MNTLCHIVWSHECSFSKGHTTLRDEENMYSCSFYSFLSVGNSFLCATIDYKPQNQAGWHKINIYNIVLHVKILKHGMYNNEL